MIISDAGVMKIKEDLEELKSSLSSSMDFLWVLIKGIEKKINTYESEMEKENKDG